MIACGGGGSGSSRPAPAIVNPVLAVGNATVTEGDSGTTLLRFAISKQSFGAAGAIIADASVDYATSADTAMEGVDYRAASGTVQIPGNVSTVTIDIEIVGDRTVEPDETFFVTLSSAVNATVPEPIGTVTILNDDSAAVLSGLDARPDNQSCIAPERPTGNASVSIVDPYPSLQDFVQPTKLILEPGPNGRWFVLQKTGQILSFPSRNPTVATEYLDLADSRPIRTASEGGLLGLAFHPAYPAIPEIFLSYTIDHSGPDMRHILSRLVLDDVRSPGAGTVEQVLLEVDQDFDNHNGGDIAFGPDGYLYFGLGDGGSGNDPNQRAQDKTRLLGSMLRLDVHSTGAGYNIPSDNPFAGNAKCGPAANASDCPEIYAWGLRNPWRWSFDEDSGQLWAADVGQGAAEEVNLIERNGNYGWRCREGSLDTGNVADCGNAAGLIDPVTEYPHSLGRSITGGFVYRGNAIPELRGLYVFADYATGRFWVARPDGQGGYDNDEIIDTELQPTAFGIGPDAELYVVDINGSNGRGRVRRLAPPANGVPDTIPERLADTGCVDSTAVRQPYAGLLPYDLNAPFWSDGATKDRYLGLPNGALIEVAADGDFRFPNGTVIVKNFRLASRLVETRLLMRHPDGVWAGYTYEWNAAQTEATRVRGGKVAGIDGQDWIFPSEAQCMECHTSAAGFALGPEIAQLNKDVTYRATGRRANQLHTFEQIGLLAAPLARAPSTLDALSSPDDLALPLEPRVRAYLHTNCAQCHRPNGPTPSTLDLRYSTLLANTNACDAPPLGVDLGVPAARLIAPGSAASSLLINRMQRRDIHRMPPIAANLVDTDNVARISRWIDALNSCD